MVDREPYDKQDRDTVKAYLNRRGISEYQAAESLNDDPLSKFCFNSLSWARVTMSTFVGLRRRKDRQRLRLFPVFINSGGVNAFSDYLGEGLHIIGIDVRCAISAWELANLALHEKTFIPEIGKMDKQLVIEYPDDVGPGEWIIHLIDHGTKLELRSALDQLFPDDLLRARHAVALAFLIVRWIWFHEVFHAIGGHCGYFAAHCRNSTVSEVNSKMSLVDREGASPSGIDWATFQKYCELIADCEAQRFMWMTRGRYHAELENLSDDTFDILSARACRTMVLIFFNALSRNSGGWHSHPDPWLRLQFLAIAKARELDRGWDELDTEIIRLEQSKAEIFESRNISPEDALARFFERSQPLSKGLAQVIAITEPFSYSVKQKFRLLRLVERVRDALKGRSVLF